MGDLFHEDVPEDFIREVFEVMRCGSTGEFCRDHIYQILTKRPERMRDFILRLQADRGPDFIRWPMPHVWLGVTAEDQKRANERIPVLLSIRAHVRFVSVEPMLGAVSVADLGWRNTASYQPRINWIICGGETGPGARPMHPDWARSLRDQCRAADVPFFFKQFGEFQQAEELRDVFNHRTGNFETIPAEHAFLRNGRRRAGRLLDGREWNERPDSSA